MLRFGCHAPTLVRTFTPHVQAQAFQRDLEQVRRDLEIAHEELATTTHICRGRIKQLEDQVTRLAALEGAHQSEVGALMVAIAHRDDELAQANIQCQQLRCELQSKAQQVSWGHYFVVCVP